MVTEFSPTIRLTVWRPAHLDRRLMIGGAVVPSAEEDNLLEEAYRWETAEDFLGSFSATDSAKLKDCLMGWFAPPLPPAERTMVKLGAAMDVLANVCRSAGADAWKDASTTEPNLDGVVNLRAHTGLALYHHIRWVHHVFKDVPGASVTIR